jgi:hypothetical protein
MSDQSVEQRLEAFGKRGRDWDSQWVLDQLAEAQRREGRLQHAYENIRMVLEHAVKDGLLTTNALDYADMILSGEVDEITFREIEAPEEQR